MPVGAGVAIATGRYALPFAGERRVERLEIALAGDDSDAAAKRYQPAGDRARNWRGPHDDPPLRTGGKFLHPGHRRVYRLHDASAIGF